MRYLDPSTHYAQLLRFHAGKRRDSCWVAFVTPARAHSGTAQFAHRFLVAVRWTSGTVWGRGGKGRGGKGVGVVLMFLVCSFVLRTSYRIHWNNR